MNGHSVGIWLDHRTAVVTTLKNNEESTEHIESGLDRWHEAPDAAVPPDRQDNRRRNEMHKFYGVLFSKIKEAQKIYLIGPGLAKKEFAKFLEENSFAGELTAVESSDKMTDGQIAAATRDFFKIN
jgi:stalled ribosome rescue protein Dom34